jgi:hypothetical protein
MPKQVAAYDDSRVKLALDKAPHIFINEINHWLNKERVNFLGFSVKGGKAKSDGGGIRGKLLNKARYGRPGGWSPGVVGQFKSFIRDKNTLHPKMTMQYADNSPLKKAMEFQEHGGGITNSKFMPTPAYSLLRESGVVEGFYKHFKASAAAGDLVPIRPRDNPGLLYWFSKKYKQLQFIGRKRITVKKQFDFHATWAKRQSKAMARGEQAIYRAVRLVEKMIKAGYFKGASNV